MFGLFFDAKIWISDALISCLGDKAIVTKGKISTSCLTVSSDSAESQEIGNKISVIGCPRHLPVYCRLIFGNRVTTLSVIAYFPKKSYWPLTTPNWPYVRRRRHCRAQYTSHTWNWTSPTLRNTTSAPPPPTVMQF